MLKYASLTLSRGYNIEKGRGGGNVKADAFNETGVFRGVSQLLLSMIVVHATNAYRTIESYGLNAFVSSLQNGRVG